MGESYKSRRTIVGMDCLSEPGIPQATRAEASPLSEKVMATKKLLVLSLGEDLQKESQQKGGGKE